MYIICTKDLISISSPKPPIISTVKYIIVFKKQNPSGIFAFPLKSLLILTQVTVDLILKKKKDIIKLSVCVSVLQLEHQLYHLYYNFVQYKCKTRVISLIHSLDRSLSISIRDVHAYVTARLDR